MGTYYFNRSSKELLRQDCSIRAALAKYSVIKTSTSFIAFNTLFTTFISYLSLSASKWRRKALLECNWVKIDLNFSNEDFFKVNKVIAAKVFCFGTIRIRSSSLTRFGFITTKKS